MSTITNKQFEGMKFHIETYDSAMEVVDKCKTRQVTSKKFHDMTTHPIDKGWHGVESYEEALVLLRDGYQPTVEAMRGVFKANKSGVAGRFSFRNNVQGFAPIVPLALKGIPNSMIDMRMVPMKAKVISVYYDITAACSVGSSDIIKAGQTLLGTIIELERQGYRFNLYACQGYSSESDCDMLVVKIKDSGQPLDLKRISFPLTHTAFFRIIGFDWYSKVPDGKYRDNYGRGIAYRLSTDKLRRMGEALFGKTSIYFSAKDIIKKDNEYIKEVIQNGNSKA